MKIFNKIATLVLATMLVSQAQAIELVKVEPVAKFTITEADKAILAQSIKLHMTEAVAVNTVLNVYKAKASFLSKSKTQRLTKVNVTAE